MNFISIEENQSSESAASNKKIKSSKNGFVKKRFNQKGGIIYIGHIPHGFYEDEMRSYFNQFGKVIAVWIARSKKTGRSRGYGFVQFKDEEVAQIAAEAMNNYLMFNKIIKCTYIPPEKRKKNVYESDISVSNYPRQKNRKTELRNKNRALSKLSQAHYLNKVQKKINKFKKFFQENNIEFNLKLIDENSKDNSINLKTKKKETKTSRLHEESENEVDNINGVLEIDGSDNEISFKTPPQVKKVIKKSSDSFPVSRKNVGSSFVGKISEKNSDKRTLKQEKSKQKTKVGIIKQTQKNKKIKENSDKRTLKQEKSKQKTKVGIIKQTQKNKKIKENSEKIQKKGKLNKKNLNKSGSTALKKGKRNIDF